MLPSLRVAAAILCGGEGRRMGGADKGRLVLDGRPFVDRQIEVLAPVTATLLIVDRDGSHPAPRGVRVVADRIPGAGAIGGIYTALEEAGTDLVVILACDMPCLTTAFVRFLLGLAHGVDVVIPRDARGRYPACGVFHRRVAPMLRSRIDRGLLRLDEALADLAVRTVEPDALAPFDHDGRLLVNINTPDDYRSILSGYHTP